MEDRIKKLEKELATANKRIDKMMADIKREGERKYTQKQVFTDRVVFRGGVYNKAGTKVIN